jgi:hypothetical protein
MVSFIEEVALEGLNSVLLLSFLMLLVLFYLELLAKFRFL